MWTVPHWDYEMDQYSLGKVQHTRRQWTCHDSLSGRLHVGQACIWRFFARCKDDGIPNEIDSPFCSVKTTITVRQSRSLEDREIGKQFAPLWEVLAEQLKILFPEGGDEGAFIVPALDARSQVLSIRIRETALENQCSNLPLLEVDSCLPVLHLTCVFLVFLVKCCRKITSQASTANVWWPPFSPLRFFAAWRVEAPFPKFQFPIGSTFCALFESLPDCARRNILSQGGSSTWMWPPMQWFFMPLLYCLVVSASQFLLVQENQPEKDFDLNCFKTFTVNTTTCLQVGAMSWTGRWIRLQGSTKPDFHPHLMIPLTSNNETILLQWTKNGRRSKSCQRGIWPKVKSKKDVVLEAQREKRKVHFATLMDICHLKNAELEQKHQKYKRRVVKDDSGEYAIFTEQGASASQMTAAKVTDVIARLPWCAGQAADVVYAYTQVKMECAPKLLNILKSECPDIWTRLPLHKWPKSCSKIEDRVVPPERNLCGHPLAGASCGKDDLRRFCWNFDAKKYSIGNVFWITEKLFLSEDVGDIKIGGKKQNMAPLWNKLMKNVDLDEPTSFLDHVALNVNVKKWTRMLLIRTEMFESRIFCYCNWKRLLGCEKPHAQKRLRGATTWKDMLKRALRDTVDWKTKRQSSCTQFQSLARTITTSRRRIWKQSENCQKYARRWSQNVCIWHELVDLTFFGL